MEGQLRRVGIGARRAGDLADDAPGEAVEGDDAREPEQTQHGQGAAGQSEPGRAAAKQERQTQHARGEEDDRDERQRVCGLPAAVVLGDLGQL